MISARRLVVSPRFTGIKVGEVAFRGQASVGLGPTPFIDWTRFAGWKGR